tara:strand:- start:22299 stop:23372 length:1074 start_codon:yes stop_codon:yes gene_type:complete
MRYHFAIPCWGSFFVDYFLKLSLPSMLAPGNLPSFAAPDNCRIQIYTRPEDRPLFDGAAIIEAARAFAVIEFRMLPEQYSTSFTTAEEEGLKCDMMSLVHMAGIKATQGQADTVVSPVNADLIYADGALGHAARRIDAGAAAVLAAIPRMSLESGRPLIEAFARPGQAELAIAPRDLVGCMRPGMLPEWRTREWGHPNFTQWPNQFFWPAGEKSFVMRALHAHPIFVRPDHALQRLTMTVDRDYVFMAVDDHDRIELIDTTDDVCMVDMSPDDYLERSLGTAGSDATTVAHWIAGFDAKPAQLRQILTPIRFVADEADISAIDAAAADSQPIAQQIVSQARTFGFFSQKFSDQPGGG